MNGTPKDTCGRCGADVPRASTEQLCPACLLSVALEPPESQAGIPTPDWIEARLPQGELDLPVEFGDYMLLGFLGRGGMGTVYEAEHLPTGRRVALKMLGEQLDSPNVRKRFLREGRLAAGVNHPNSLYIFGSEEIEGLPVITMEIAGSGTLEDRLRDRGPLPIAEAVDAVLDVISGLESAFAGGVLHRDIKPSNCFVCPDGSVKVGDFGLSVSTLATTDTFVTVHEKIMGTPAFASPEQLLGDTLDLRGDIYSVGATLFTLLTGRAPFEGDNAVQVVANVVNKEPTPLSELRRDVPPALERVVARCLSKKRDGRYADYAELRNALLPFSSSEPDPAPLTIRAQSGWVDYLIAFLIPYVILILSIGNEGFHLGPFVERTLYSARYYITFLAFGFLYFSLAEGIWGAGPGKRLKGLRVVRTDGRPPGVGRALIRIMIPILCIEGVRIPVLMAALSGTPIDQMSGSQVALFFGASFICPWIPVLLTLRARPENGYATFWDIASGTRVVTKPKGTVRPGVASATRPEIPVEHLRSLGPYGVKEEVVPGKWLLATDPLLRREVWLLRRESVELPVARREVARPGRLRWLQKVETEEATWDALEAIQGTPFSELVEDGKTVPWSTMRHWLHDVASELWAAVGDQTLPAELSLGHVWITSQGQAVLLDEPWPGVENASGLIAVGDLSGQQRFLNAIAASVEPTSLPLHARPWLQNLESGKMEKLSFLTGVLRGLLGRPSEVGKGIRAGSLLMMPFFVWAVVFVGTFTGEGRIPEALGDSVAWFMMNSMILVLIGSALVQLFLLPFRTSVGFQVFRLALVDAEGKPARRSTLLVRWATVWAPLFVSLGIVALMSPATSTTFFAFLVLFLFWFAAVFHAVVHPNRGLPDRLAKTWVVRH